MKESEVENAPEAWQSAVHSYKFANYMVQLNPEDYSMTLPTYTGVDPTDLDEIVLLKNKATIPAFESNILHCCTRRMRMMGYKLHVMTQATYPEDQANLLNGVLTAPEGQFIDAPEVDTEEDLPLVLEDAVKKPKEGKQGASKSKGKKPAQATEGAEAPPEETPPDPKPTEPHTDPAPTEPQPGTSKAPNEDPTQAPTNEPEKPAATNPMRMNPQLPPSMLRHTKQQAKNG